MGQTIAEALREEGKIEGKIEGVLQERQQMLVSLLRHKFSRKVTAAMVSRIERTKDLDQLEKWSLNFAKADTIDEVGIIPGKKL
jgi:hypothetical protein